MGMVTKRTVLHWHEGIPDIEEVMDWTKERQIIAYVDGGSYISGHWEVTGEEILDVVFIPDFLTKDIITNDEIAAWLWEREL